MTFYTLELRLSHEGNASYTTDLRLWLPDETRDVPLVAGRPPVVTLDYPQLLQHATDPEAYGRSLKAMLFQHPDRQLSAQSLNPAGDNDAPSTKFLDAFIERYPDFLPDPYLLRAFYRHQNALINQPHRVREPRAHPSGDKLFEKPGYVDQERQHIGSIIRSSAASQRWPFPTSATT
jgi:hypothetical protein